MRYPKANYDIFRVDIYDAPIDDYLCCSEEPLEVCHLDSCEFANEFLKCVAIEHGSYMDDFEANQRAYIKVLGGSNKRVKSSIEEPLEVNLKELPEHLRYAYLGEKKTLIVIIYVHLNAEKENKLLRVLQSHMLAIGWNLVDINKEEVHIIVRIIFS